MTVVVVLLVAWRHGGWRWRTAVPAVVGAVLIIGYAAARVVATWRTAAAGPPRASATDVADLTMAVSMAVAELTACLLLVVGLDDSSRPMGASPASA
ncbi:hypothetical protein AB0A95_29250 [Micromonospora sp. NPDC049230]|uniref:hypothetical protein n=1 Tax=Micromonospora sp. NPDC049230 TaxID=3155502 RepID=UPI00340FE8FD